MTIEEISLWPELSSPSRFRIQGGYPDRDGVVVVGVGVVGVGYNALSTVLQIMVETLIIWGDPLYCRLDQPDAWEWFKLAPSEYVGNNFMVVQSCHAHKLINQWATTWFVEQSRLHHVCVKLLPHRRHKTDLCPSACLSVCVSHSEDFPKFWNSLEQLLLSYTNSCQMNEMIYIF